MAANSIYPTMNVIPQYQMDDFFESDNHHHFDIDVLNLPETYSYPDLAIPHKHSFYSILIVSEGEGMQAIDFTFYPLKGGRIFFLSPHQLHQWKKVTRLEGFAISFSTDFLDTLITDREIHKDFRFLHSLTTLPFIDIPHDSFIRVLEIIKHIQYIYSESSPFKEKILAANLCGLLYTFIEFLSPRYRYRGNKDLHLFTKLTDLVEDNYKLHLETGFYSSSLHITYQKLNRLCRHFSEKPFKQFLIDRLMLEAKRMMHATALPVAEIAFALGYDDPGYFARLFKQHYSVTPTDYKESIDLS
ncbi:MAG: AraC family transcriptional regulator [Ignavibacteria bacterium]|nr:AraC family transcriptional regulator [Ignavibacteria bacterium]